MLPPNCARLANGAAALDASRVRAPPTRLLVCVSKMDPCNVLVPLLVLAMTATGVLYFAETLFVSTLTSWIESSPGCRYCR